MASIPKLLMDEFYSMNRDALKEEQYDRAQAFSSAENAVNNVMHGLQPALVLSLVKATLSSLTTEESLPEAEREAFAEAVIVVDIFAEQYNLELVENPVRPM
jgi:hypothetical protein